VLYIDSISELASMLVPLKLEDD